MKCPICKGGRLEPADLEPGLAAQRCQTCEGVFVPFKGYLEWQSTFAAGSHEAPASQELGPDSPAAKLCPSCGHFMTRFRVARDFDAHIDRCGACAGVWLDSGEWERLRALGLHTRLNAAFAESWQHRLREEERVEQRERRLAAILGEEDLRRAHEIKAWLDNHPQRATVLAFFEDRL